MSTSLGGYYPGYVTPNIGQTIQTISGSAVCNDGVNTKVFSKVTGKDFYCTSMSIMTAGVLTTLDINNGAAHDQKFTVASPLTSVMYTNNSVTPVKFDSDVYVRGTGNNTRLAWNLVGWYQ